MTTKAQPKAKPRSKPKAATTLALAKRKMATRRAERKILVPMTGPMPPQLSKADVDLMIADKDSRLERVLTDDVLVGQLGLVEVTLTPEEEKVLGEPPPADEILIKPTGQAYLSHPTYTRWFNRAFGRLGWGLQPCAKPQLQQKEKGATVVQPFILFIHGKPARFAHGEHEYYESNKEQTYGDALESTRASALRRCAKAMGVGLEMWDKNYLHAFIERNCVRVSLQGETKKVWRRKVDPPFWNEVSGKQARPAPSRVADVAQHAGLDNHISEQARDRLWNIARRKGRSDAEVKDYLMSQFKVKSSTEIKTRDYDTIIRAIEHPGPLVTKREPGQEG